MPFVTKPADREKLFEQWQEPEDAVRVLVCSVLLASSFTDSNLQKGFHVAVCLSVTDDIDRPKQLLSCLHQYGQQHEQTLYVVTLANSYDHVLQTTMI